MKKKIVAALLITVMAAGIFSGCGNRMEGDSRGQAAMAAARDGGRLDSGATTEPIAEPATGATAEPTAEPATAQASGNAQDTTNITGATQASANTGNTGNTMGQTANQNQVQGQGTTAQTQTTGQNSAVAAKTDDTAESYTSAFLELLNADRRDAGLPEVSAGSSSLEAQALKRAVEATTSTTLIVGVGVSFESMAGGTTDVAVAYNYFKTTTDTWGHLMAQNLESVSVARCGVMWILEGSKSAVIVNADNPANNITVPENPITNMTTEEAVDAGLLEEISSTDGTTTYISPGETTVLSPEEAAAVLGEDW